MLRLCFVCLGNICRSPTAEGVMRRLVADARLDGHVHVESAGTAAAHAGEPADERSAAAARRRSVELTSIARRFTASDFARFDYVVAMDRENLDALVARAPDSDAAAKLSLLRGYEPAAAAPDVPDPYYGGPRGFDDVFEICESACASLLAHLRREHGLRAGRPGNAGEGRRRERADDGDEVSR